ncbi:DUF2325 domain-containing protein [Herbaspirillum sp. SJZ107]|uniref:DUF2325 domain-containing protein n=1 Tax=Herbaspirillum sp. SJZ107 TaxID=2572881 RepID=UPI0011518B7F|nr:DUF2325 domain-containing protein [Herbaspirillum sp. SJZ107]TQK10663.1 uncharacterized protein DUF2325 [Herbaspirillum sp. SJZ107]
MCEHAIKDSCTGEVEPVGSRRRRLWELPTNCHCPLIGVCLPLAMLRRLVNKLLVRPLEGDDYDVHVWAVHECASRNRMAELLQRTLDERFATVLRQFRGLRDAAALHAAWRQAVERGDVAGPFWATLTHPRCDLAMIENVVRDMHMIQHQAGASTRVDLGRFAELQKQNAGISRELEQTRDKAARTADARTRELARLTAEGCQLRAELAQRDSTIESLRRELDTLQAALPDLRDRERLARRVEELEAREQALSDKMAQLRQRFARERQEAATPPPLPPVQPAPAAVSAPALDLADKTVLCVGGRSGNVPNYRDLLEKEGARFMHHDGGLEQASELLDTSLAAADLVICQTGCISHQAYWRVKDFCKRNGKRCVFVDNPSTSSFSVCLRKVAMPVADGVT